MMLAVAAAVALQFAGTTEQRLPVRFVLRDGVVANLAVVASAACGRLGPVTEAIRFRPIRVGRDRRFYAVARDVPLRVAPQGDLSYLTGRLVSPRRAVGLLRFRFRRQDPQLGVVACTGRVSWTGVSRTRSTAR